MGNWGKKPNEVDADDGVAGEDEDEQGEGDSKFGVYTGECGERDEVFSVAIFPNAFSVDMAFAGVAVAGDEGKEEKRGEGAGRVECDWGPPIVW